MSYTKSQSPIIIPPEATSKNWVSRDFFNLASQFAATFKLTSQNIGKEMIFGVFFVDSMSTDPFGATTKRGTLTDYSTKGEVGEGIDIDGEKLVLNFENTEYDLLLDHVYPYNVTSLVRNQIPINTEGLNPLNEVSIIFDSTRSYISKVEDNYGNSYFDELECYDVISKERVTQNDLANYQYPLFIQRKNIFYIYEMGDIDILNIRNVSFRIIIENFGNKLKMDILYPEKTEFDKMFDLDINLELGNRAFMRFGYCLTTPVISYDVDKIANLEIGNLTLQGKILK